MKKLNVILFIIICILVGYIVYDKVLSKKTVEESVNDKTEEKQKVHKDVKYYTYNKDNVSKSVYLFEDKTYYYSFSIDECNNWSKGTYKEDGKNLTLNEEMHASCDSCYYTSNLKIYDFIYDGKEKLVSNDNETFTKSDAEILPIVDVELIDGINNCTE